MTLQERLEADFRQTMKSGNKPRLAALRMAKAALKNAEIDKRSPLDDAEAVEVLTREAKRRRESIAEFRKANRPDAVAKEEADLSILLEYLPQQMSEDDIKALVQQVITEVGARSPKDKGKVMSTLMPQVKGKADGQAVNRIVTDLLDTL